MLKSDSDERGFFMLRSQSVVELVQNPAIKNADLRIFLWLSAKASFKTNRVICTRKALCEKLDFTYATVRSAILRLEKFGYIEEGKSSLGSSYFQLQPQHSWKGKTPRLVASKKIVPFKRAK